MLGRDSSLPYIEGLNMNVQELNNMIQELEKSEPSLSNIRNLSSLYIVRKNLLENNVNIVTKELNDILPSYIDYVKIKRKYQLNEVTEQAVYLSMQQVCGEIKEFLHILYSNTDTSKERKMIRNLIDHLKEAF